MAKILIAEDDPTSRKLVTHVVDSLGHCSFVSPNGRHAWEALDCGNNFAMLITDVVMPDMDGRTLIQTLRADPRFAALPVVIMSAVVGVSEIAGLLKIGATWFMPKPMDRATLQEYIERSLK